MRRVFLLMAASIAGMTVSALGSTAHAQSADRESFAVFTAVLDSMYRSLGDRPSIVIVPDSLYERQGGVAYQGKLLRPHESNVDPATIADFEKVTARSIPFPRQFRYKGKLHILSTIEYEQIHTRGNSLASAIPARQLREMPYWLGFMEKYPKAWGVTVLSRVGFNNDKTQALVYVRHQCGGGCFSSETVFLTKRKNLWRIAERISDGFREGFASGSMRYLGPGAHMLADRRRMEDSTRRAVADSIRRDRAPRRIRGTVVNRTTGFPLSHVQIFVRSHSPFGGDSLRRVVADSHGRFDIRNPPIGGTMLVVECPGPAHRAGSELDAPSLYVFPELDTVLVLGPPDISPCWSHKRRIPDLMVGWLESAKALDAATPTEEERAVFSVALTQLRSDHHGNPAWIMSHTARMCEYHESCGNVALPAMLTSGMIDSATVADFKSKSRSQSVINPSFARSENLEIITPEHVEYYASDWRNTARYSHVDDETAPAFWAAFRDRNGSDARIIAFSRAGFNADQSEALVEVRVDSGAPRWYNRPTMIFLKKRDGAWKIESKDVGKIQREGSWTARGCLPVVAADANITRSDVLGLMGDYIVTLVPSVGRKDTRSVRMRISRKPKDSLELRGLDGSITKRPYPATPNAGHVPPVFEIIDEKTGKVDDAESMDFGLAGAGVAIPRRVSTLRFDGYSQQLRIRSSNADGFAGSYAAGVFGNTEFGVFCARRANPIAK
jgi:hypothetical protein